MGKNSGPSAPGPGVLELIRGLVGFPRMLALHPGDHPLILREVERFGMLVRDLGGARFRLGIDTMTCNGDLLTRAPGLVAQFRSLLSACEIIELCVQPGVESGEWRSFGRWLAMATPHPAPTHPHITVRLASETPGGDEAAPLWLEANHAPLPKSRFGLPEAAATSEALRNAQEEHCGATQTLLVSAELVAKAPKAFLLERRQESMRAALQGAPPEAVATAITELERIRPSAPPIEWSLVVRDIAGSVRNESVLVALLSRIQPSQLEEARGLIDRLGEADNATALLAGLLRFQLPELVRALLIRTLTRVARVRAEAWCLWGLHNPDVLLTPNVFGTLLATAPDLLSPITRVLLTREPDSHHCRLVEMLTAHGGDNALRLLVGGMTWDDTPCDRLLLAALGKFEQPLALGVLSEVVHRSNTGKFQPKPVRAALGAVREVGTPEALAFLTEVADGRVGCFYRFRRELRAMAREEVTA